MRRHKMGTSQLLVLAKVVDHSSTMAEVAEVNNLSAENLTGIADSLEKESLIERKPFPNDRRKINLHATDLGRQVMSEIGKSMGGRK